MHQVEKEFQNYNICKTKIGDSEYERTKTLFSLSKSNYS